MPPQPRPAPQGGEGERQTALGRRRVPVEECAIASASVDEVGALKRDWPGMETVEVIAATGSADRALVVLDPRQPETARMVAESKLEVARAAKYRTMLEGELAVQAAYPALRDFLRDLSTLPTWSEVQEVHVESASGTGIQKGRVRVVIYRQAPSETSKSL